METKRIFLHKQRPAQRKQRTVATASRLKVRIIEALRQVYDPEIPVNIYDLGLIYQLDIAEDGRVAIDMTLTAPSCPVADELVKQVEGVVSAVDGVTHASIKLVWDPPWDQSRMSEAAQFELGFF